MKITSETLIAYLSGELDAARRAQVETALARDPALHAEYERLQQTFGYVADHLKPDDALRMSPHRREQVEQALRRMESAGEAHPRKGWFTPMVWAPAMAVAVIAVGIWQATPVQARNGMEDAPALDAETPRIGEESTQVEGTGMALFQAAAASAAEDADTAAVLADPRIQVEVSKFGDHCRVTLTYRPDGPAEPATVSETGTCDAESVRRMTRELATGFAEQLQRDRDPSKPSEPADPATDP